MFIDVSIEVFMKSSLFMVTSSFKVLVVMLIDSSAFFFESDSASLPSSNEEEDLFACVASTSGTLWDSLPSSCDSVVCGQ